MKRIAGSFVFLLACVICRGSTWTEVGDAGSLPGAAQLTVGSGALTSITGTLTPQSGDAVDMFKIYITGGGTFSATTVGGASFDTELFLFDSTGHGVYANDDVSGSLAPSTLPAGNALTPTSAGYYYIAVAQCCDEATSAGGLIFDLAASHDSLLGPVGPGGGSPVTGFSGGFDQNPGGGGYTITLTGAGFASTSTSSVPEPAGAGLCLAGVGALLVASAASRGWARHRGSV